MKRFRYSVSFILYRLYWLMKIVDVCLFHSFNTTFSIKLSLQLFQYLLLSVKGKTINHRSIKLST